MKKTIYILLATLACLLFAFPALSQTYGLDHVKVYSGKGPLNSGLGLTVDLVRGEQELCLNFDKDQGYGNWRFDKVGKLELLLTGGIFMQTPWIGPMLKINYNSHLSTTHWVGWTAGEVENPTWTTDFMFSWQEIGYDTNSFYLYYAGLNFQQNKWQDLAGVTYKLGLSPNWQLRLGYDRDFNIGQDMFTWGIKFSPRG